MTAHSGQTLSTRRTDAPSTIPIATPMPSQIATCPAITPATAPSAAPSAMPNPVYFGLFMLCSKVDRANFLSRQLPRLAPRLAALGGTGETPVPTQAGPPRRLSLRLPCFLLRCISWLRCVGLRSLVPDLPHFAQQFRHRHARERLE